MTQPLLDFGPPARYPIAPGHRAGATATSAESARNVARQSVTYRTHTLRVLREKGALTADEIADHIGVSILTIRPRVTELKRLGLIRDTGLRRENASGHRAAVWETVP